MKHNARNRLKSSAKLAWLAGLGLLAAGLAYGWLTPKVYQAAARVRIENKGVTRAGRLRAADVSEAPMMAAECKVMGSDALLGQVIVKLDLARAWGGRAVPGAGTNATLTMLHQMVRIQAVPDTSVIEVRVRSANRAETAPVANEIVRLYLADHAARQQGFAKDRVLAIPAQWEKGNEKLRGVQDQFVQVSAELLRAQATDTNVYFDAKALDTLRARRIDLETAVNAREGSLRRLQALTPDQLRQVLPTTVTNSLLNGVLIQLMDAQRQLTVARGSSGPDSPEVKRAMLAVQELDRHATEIIGGLMGNLESDLAMQKSQLEKLDQELSRAKTMGAGFSTNNAAYVAALREVRLHEQERALLESRLNQESLEAVYPLLPVAELVEGADPPTRPASPNDRIVLGTCGSGGLVLLAGVGLFLLAGQLKRGEMMRKVPPLLLAIAFLALPGLLWGQRSYRNWSWRVYRASDGLGESSCLSVTIGPKGKVWVRHPAAPVFSGLDGYSVETLPAPGPGNGRIYESPSGSQFWTAGPDGLKEYNRESPDKVWVAHYVEKIAKAFAGGLASPHPVPLLPVRQGRVLFLIPEGLMEFTEFKAEVLDRRTTKTLRAAAETPAGPFSGMVVDHEGRLWITGARGLLRSTNGAKFIKPDSDYLSFPPPASFRIQNLREPQVDEDNGITAIADDLATGRRVVVHFDGQAWAKFPVGNEPIRFAWRGPEKLFWAATTNAVFQLRGDDPPQPVEDMSAREYFDVSVEANGNFWLATSDGLFRHAPQAWRAPHFMGNVNDDIQCFAEDAEDRLWFASPAALHVLAREQHREFAYGAAIRPSAVRAIFPLKDGTLLLDGAEGLLQFRPADQSFHSVRGPDPARRLEPLGSLLDGSVCLQACGLATNTAVCELEVYDGAEFHAFTNAPDPSFSGKFTSVFEEPNGDVWLSNEHGTARRHDNKWRIFNAAVASVPENAGLFANLADGKIWCAAQDKLWKFDGQNWSSIMSGRGPISALARGVDGSLWLVANGSLNRFTPKGARIENGLDEGLPSAAVRKVYTDRAGRIWAGTSRGISLYHPEADLDPPQMEPLSEKAARVIEGTAFNLNFSGLDKWNYTPPELLLYSYRLDAGDWTAFQSLNNVPFPDLPVGKHYFELNAMDRNGNEALAPARLEFSVVLPWHKAPLVLVSFVALAFTVFFALLAFQRHRQLVRSYTEVEEKIAQRTRELEIANRELFHSQKMNALGTLSAGIAHDFNNILSIVKGSAQIIEDNLDNPQKVQTRVERIKTVTEQGAGIVKAMLGFSRTSDLAPANCDLNSVVGETTKLLGDRFLREVEVSFQPAAGLPPVNAAADFIQQILLNFIFNAAEAMTERREVILRTGLLQKLPSELVLPPAPAAAWLFVSVQDFGCGIAPETFPRIFEPFFTTKAMSARRGTGLGLSMAYELARKLSAGLAVESVLGQGSTFTLILPARDLPVDAGG